MTARLAGVTNLALGMLEAEGIAPIGAGLQEPFLSCWPLVMGRSGSVAQKLMKLMEDVSEATSPASDVFVFRPFCAKFAAITEDRRVKEVWAPLELVDPTQGEAVGTVVVDGIVKEGVTVALAVVSAWVAQGAGVPDGSTSGEVVQLMVERVNIMIGWSLWRDTLTQLTSNREYRATDVA